MVTGSWGRVGRRRTHVVDSLLDAPERRLAAVRVSQTVDVELTAIFITIDGFVQHLFTPLSGYLSAICQTCQIADIEP
jgi:hypothetical protein